MDNDNKISRLETIKGLWKTGQGQETMSLFQTCLRAAKAAVEAGFIGHQPAAATTAKVSPSRYTR